MRWAVILLVLLGLASSLFAASCGNTRPTAPAADPAPVEPPNLVSVDDVKSARSDVEQAILAWAQAVQFSDPRTVVASYTPRAVARGGARRIADAVRAIGASLGRPEPIETTSTGPRSARVRAYLVAYNTDRRPVARQPVTFYLRKIRGVWRLDDAALLLDTYRDVAETRSRGPGSAAPPADDGA